MAIAFNTSADFVFPSNVTSDTHAFTCSSGSQRYLQLGLVQGQGSNTDNITNIAYAGANMSRLSTLAIGASRIYLYGLIAPATGTNNIVITCVQDAAGGGWIFAEDFTGVSQSGVPTNLATGGGLLQTGMTVTITVGASSSWVGGLGSEDTSQISISSGGTIRSNTQNAARANFDTNGTVAAGSFSTVWASTTNPSNWLGISAEIVSAAGGVSAAPRKTLLGVGI